MSNIPEEETIKEIWVALEKWSLMASEKGLEDEYIAQYLMRASFILALKNSGEDPRLNDVLAKTLSTFTQEIELLKKHFINFGKEN